MKLLLAALFLTACGQFDGSDGQNGSSCTTRNDSVGVFIECTDGTDTFIPFPEDGKSGSSCSVDETGLVLCTDGSAYQIKDGLGCDLVEKEVVCSHNRTKRFKQYLKCSEKEVFIKNVSIRGGC